MSAAVPSPDVAAAKGAAVSGAVDELLKLTAEPEGEEGQEPEPITEPSAATPPAPQKRVVSLDEDVLPDIEDVSPTRRGQPVRELLKELKTTITQRDMIGTRANDFESRAIVAERALAVLSQRLSQPESPKPAVEPSADDDIKDLGITPASLALDPEGAIAAAVKLGAALAKKELLPKIEKIEQRVGGTEQIQNATITRNAYWTAASQDKNHDRWKDDDWMNAVARHVESNGWPTQDPRAYLAAAEYIDNIGTKFYGARPATAAATATIPVIAPPPAPPTGGAPSGAAPVVTTKTKFSDRDQENLKAIRDAFPNLKDDVWAEIIAGADEDHATIRSRKKV